MNLVITPPTWIAWKAIGQVANRWSSTHYTKNGRVTLCGVPIPTQCKEQGISPKDCAACRKKLNRERQL